MREIKFTVTDPLGFHARPAGNLVKEAKNFNSKVIVKNGDKSGDLRKLLEVMGLNVRQNDEITVLVEGVDEAACAEAVEKFLKENF